MPGQAYWFVHYCGLLEDSDWKVIMTVCTGGSGFLLAFHFDTPTHKRLVWFGGSSSIISWEVSVPKKKTTTASLQKLTGIAHWQGSLKDPWHWSMDLKSFILFYFILLFRDENFTSIRRYPKKVSGSEMTLNYWMIVERYRNCKDKVGGSIPGCEIVSLLDRNLQGGQVLPCVKKKKFQIFWRRLEITMIFWRKIEENSYQMQTTVQYCIFF